MGIYQNTFVGPCIKVKNPTRTTNRQGQRCSNVNCKNHKKETMDSRFCPKCGSKVEHHPIPQPMSIYQILENEGVDEDLFFDISPDMHELAEKNVTILTDNSDDYASHNQSLTPQKIEDSLKQFKEKFEMEIQMLSKYYLTVQVEFMVFTYYS